MRKLVDKYAGEYPTFHAMEETGSAPVERRR
ncbi:hypothetical protein M2263_003072 [Providencia alcalifaciens]|nr:hypothetical protein [Providencia alcalifaciens]